MSLPLPSAMTSPPRFFCGFCNAEFLTGCARDEHELDHLYDPEEGAVP